MRRRAGLASLKDQEHPVADEGGPGGGAEQEAVARAEPDAEARGAQQRDHGGVGQPGQGGDRRDRDEGIQKKAACSSPRVSARRARVPPQATQGTPVRCRNGQSTRGSSSCPAATHSTTSAAPASATLSQSRS